MKPTQKTGRNQTCPCGSGKKYKRCCSDPAGPRHENMVRTVGSSSTPVAQLIWAVGLICLVGVAVYQNSFAGSFLFDDRAHILDNTHLRHLWPIGALLAHADRPLVELSLAINYAIGGLTVWGYHAVNLIIHVAAALALFGIVRRTLQQPSLALRYGQGASGFALVIALVWLVHPLQTQSVTYIVQRAESLMGLWYLLTLYCVIRGAQTVSPFRWNMAAISCCALGMASKPIMITAPLLVLLYDRSFLTNSVREAWRLRHKLYFGLASTWLLLILIMANKPLDSVGFSLKNISVLDYAITQPGVILHYLRLSLWPNPLVFDYVWPIASSTSTALLPLLIVGPLLVGTVMALWRRHPIGFLGAWFFLILAPTSSFYPIADLIFEHRMYLSLAAVITFGVLGGWQLLRVFITADAPRRLVAIGLAGTWLIILGMLTVARNKNYHSPIRMWQDVVDKQPMNARAYNNLGLALADRRDYQESISHYRHSLRLRPGHARTHNNLGVALTEIDQVEEAMVELLTTVRLQPNLAEGHNNLGAALTQQGQVGEALTHYREAIRLDPDYAKAFNNMGFALAEQGKISEAMEQYARALWLRPDDAEIHNNLGMALASKNKVTEALNHFRESLRLSPDFAWAHNNLGSTLAIQGHLKDAEHHFARALELDPDFSSARINLEMVRQDLRSSQKNRER